ncbi:MAG: DUF1641 domain-containing protein [Haloarculaceae archaeon]
MSDSTGSIEEPPAELAAAIEDNPEAVATFVERLDAVNELVEVLELGTDALDDDMAVSLAETAATLGESADGLATEETVTLAENVGENGESLGEALETLATLQERGTLDDLVELAAVVSLLRDALDDDMAVSLASTGNSLGELADSAAEEDTRDGLESVLEAVGDAQSEEVPRVGTLGLLRATRDEEVQAGLGYLIVLARALGRRTGPPAEE